MKPMRQPVIEYDLENVPEITTRSRTEISSDAEVNAISSKTMSLYASSDRR